MSKTIYILFFIFSFLFFSCEKYIDMEIPNNDRKIVLNCIYSDTGQVYVELFKSRFILDNADYDIVNDALVVLYENNIAVDTLIQYIPGKYKTNNFTFQPNTKHKIVATKDAIQVQAESSIPAKPIFYFIDTTSVSSEWDESYRIKIGINDPISIDNYYFIKFEIEENENENVLEYDNTIYFSTDEMFIEDTYNNAGIFSDIQFNGNNQTLSFLISKQFFYNEPDTIKLNILLMGVSKEMYLYFKSLSKQQNSLGSLFAEPVMVYSNIQDGFGVFGGFSISQIQLKIPTYSIIIEEEK